MFSPTVLADEIEARSEPVGLWQPKEYAARDVVLLQGDANSAIYVQVSGLTKLTYISSDGDEWIKSFVADAGLFGTLSDSNSSGSRFGAVAIEPSVIVKLSASWVREQMERDAALAALTAQFTAWLAERKQLREEMLLCSNPEERYLSMLRNDAPLISRLPQGDIARFLRITPIAFSRIKRRLRESI